MTKVNKTVVDFYGVRASLDEELVWVSDDQGFADLLNAVNDTADYTPDKGYPDLYLADFCCKQIKGLKIVSEDQHIGENQELVY